MYSNQECSVGIKDQNISNRNYWRNKINYTDVDFLNPMHTKVFNKRVQDNRKNKTKPLITLSHIKTVQDASITFLKKGRTQKVSSHS